MLMLSVMLLGLSPWPAQAADRWEEAGSGAVAILPAPSKAVSILSGSLVCTEQSWSFRLRTQQRPALPATAMATIVIGDEIYTETVTQTDTTITLPVAVEMLDAMKTGSRLGFSLGRDKALPRALFSLRNSQKVIEAVAPRCSQIDMTAFEKIELSGTDAAVATAQSLLEDDIRQFTAATTATPTLTAHQVDREAGKSLLFSTLCGSKWYYGRSGCTLIGFARDSAAAEWKQVYDSEGMLVYLDPKTSNVGWPNVVTLQMAGATAPLHWIFTGSAYELRDAVMAADAPPPDGEGDTSE